MGSFQLKMNIAIVVITIVVLLIEVPKAGQKVRGTYNLKRKKKLHNRYAFYYNNVLLRGRFKRIVVQFATISCYNHDELKERSVQVFEKAVGVSALMPIIMLVVTKDVLLAMLVVLLAYVYYNMTVEDKIEKVNAEVYRQTADVITSYRDNYLASKNILTALLQCQKGKYVEIPIKQIYEVLACNNREDALHEYCQKTPIRIMKTLAIVSYIFYIYGDNDKEGESDFTEVLQSIWQETDYSIRRIVKTRLAFKSLAIIALVGLIATPVMDAFLLNKIPGTTAIIKGLYGSFEKVFIIGLTGVTYYIISVLSKVATVNQVDKVEWVDNLSKHSRMKKIVKNIIPKKYKTRVKKHKLLQSAISSKTIEYMYTLKLITAPTLFICSVLFIGGFVIASKSTVWNHYGSMSFSVSNEMKENQMIQLKRVDKIYMTSKTKMDNETTVKLLMGRVKGLTEYDAKEQAKRLSEKWDKYYSIGWKWYYYIVAYAIAMLGWFIPEISLILRKKLVSYEAAEDVAQLQTVLSALAKTNVDTLKAIYWLEKASDIHKAPLRYAYHEYTSDPEGALERLRSSAESNSLKNIADKLKSTIYSLSIEEAFSDMLVTKESTLVVRETMREEVLKSKTQYARLLASSTLFAAIIFGLIVPIMILAFQSLGSALDLI